MLKIYFDYWKVLNDTNFYKDLYTGFPGERGLWEDGQGRPMIFSSTCTVIVFSNMER